MNNMDEASNIAGDYINAYFTHLAQKETRGKLRALYRDDSTVTYGDIQLLGLSEILDFLDSTPFDNLNFTIADMKTCPSPARGILVLVIGESNTDGLKQKVVETFYLDRAADNGDFYISSQILTMLDAPKNDDVSEVIGGDRIK